LGGGIPTPTKGKRKCGLTKRGIIVFIKKKKSGRKKERWNLTHQNMKGGTGAG